ncbi:chromate transporter [Tissierella creatinophila]|uniref:Putative chromate transport protein n=1 Tax=Tissierella creatinophila DSM 6911 TaxID=1123403 RepID=A0A1U7M4G8_TISCR|nr:chromate transporter [Tissierella creatinophila]OLS02088.1 putative chromate transport protein [Tissierella creatinophila DSM 6911]
MIHIKLFFVFFKIGLFSIGGGLATLPFLQQLVSKYGWITSEELVNMIAISESTPGPIGVNTATFVGNSTAGIFGGIIATLGLIAPSIIIIIVIAHYFSKFSEEHIVKSAFYGIRPAVAGLIGAAGFEVAKITLINPDVYFNANNILDFLDMKGIILFMVMLYLINKYKKHPIIYIIGAAIIGVIFRF